MAVPRTPAQAVQQNNRDAGGRYATKQHAEAEFTTPDVDPGDVTRMKPSEARLFVASREIRDELRFNGVVSGLAPARRLPDGNIAVDIEAGKYPDEPLWVASEGDVSALVLERDERVWFDVSAAQDRFGKLQAAADATVNAKIEERAVVEFAHADELLNSRAQLAEAQKQVAALSGQYVVAELRHVAPGATEVLLSRDSEGSVFIARVHNAAGETIYDRWTAHHVDDDTALAQHVDYLNESTRTVEDACAGMRNETTRTVSV